MKALFVAALVAVAAIGATAEPITAKTCSDNQCTQGCNVGTFETGVCTSANNGAYMMGSCEGGVASVKLFTTSDCSGSALPFVVGNTCANLYQSTFAVSSCGAPAMKSVRL